MRQPALAQPHRDQVRTRPGKLAMIAAVGIIEQPKP